MNASSSISSSSADLGRFRAFFSRGAGLRSLRAFARMGPGPFVLQQSVSRSLVWKGLRDVRGASILDLGVVSAQAVEKVRLLDAVDQRRGTGATSPWRRARVELNRHRLSYL